MSERFYVEQDGASWCVRDREIVYTLGMARGQPRRVQWFNTQEEAARAAQEMNRTRGHASDEPKCVECGAQPAGPVGSDTPRCGTCWSRLSRGD